jgi:acyl carrier protein
MMTVKEIMEVLETVLDLEEGTAGIDQDISHLSGYDSVQALRLLTHLESISGQKIDFESYYKAQTVRDLAGLFHESSSC